VSMQHLVKNEFQRKQLLTVVEKLEIPDCGYMFEYFRADDKRNAEQNNLLWVSAYRPIANFLGEQSGKIITAEMVHAVAKDRFLDPIIVEYEGKSKSYPGSTTQLGKKDFGEYIEKVYAWGAEMGCWFE